MVLAVMESILVHVCVLCLPLPSLHNYYWFLRNLFITCNHYNWVKIETRCHIHDEIGMDVEQTAMTWTQRLLLASSSSPFSLSSRFSCSCFCCWFFFHSSCSHSYYYWSWYCRCSLLSPHLPPPHAWGAAPLLAITTHLFAFGSPSLASFQSSFSQ